MTIIELIRHAEAEGNLYRRIHGQYNSRLSPNGLEQREYLRRRFANISLDAVWSSDLRRTGETAQALLSTHPGLRLQLHPGLRELNFGSWEDLSWGDLRQKDPEGLEGYRAFSPEWMPPGGEGFLAARDRVYAALEEIARKEDGRHIAVFSHGVVIRGVLARIMGEPVNTPKLSFGENASVTRLRYDGGKFTIEDLYDISHVPEELRTRYRNAKNHVMDTGSPNNIRFRPMDPGIDLEWYLGCYEDAWFCAHGNTAGFEKSSYAKNMLEHRKEDPQFVSIAMRGEERVGIVELSMRRYGDRTAANLAFFYLIAPLRGMGSAVQLLGQAVSLARRAGKEKLRLCVASGNIRARRFYEKNGFVHVGETLGAHEMLPVLEKDISI